jgi:hypothetical protein
MFESAIQEYMKYQESSPEELEDVQFIDCAFETLGVKEMDALMKYPNIEFLNLASVGLKSVTSAFPSHPKISVVILSNNELTDDVVETLAKLSNLESLALDGNQVTSVDSFKHLVGLSGLREVALSDCPVTASDPEYRSKLFALLPQLELVDGVDKEGKSHRESSSEELSEDVDSDDSQQDSIDLSELYGESFGEEDDGDEDEEDDDDDDEDNDDDEDDDDVEEDDEEEESGQDAKRTRHE